jgi:DNA polymerase-4
MKRWILHMDMDAFYASIEQRDHPEYRGKPLMVGSPPNQRGIIATCSYEARKYGVRSAMPSRRAGELCPHGIFVPPNMKKYSEESAKIMNILQSFTPYVEVVSIDEAFLDVTSVRNLLGTPFELAQKIKNRISSELNLTCSIGIAPNKFLAKLASDLEKPNGLTTITEDNKISILAPLEVGKLWGVGGVAQKRLMQNGIKTIGDIQRMSIRELMSVMGNQSEHLHNLSMGEDDRVVEMDSETKSIGSENTFDHDTLDQSLLRKTLLDQSDEIASKLRKSNLAALTIALKLRYEDFVTISRQITLDEPTQNEMTVYEKAIQLFDKEDTSKQKVRLIGLSARHLVPPRTQLDLFGSNDKRDKLSQVIDQIRHQHGRDSIKRGL